MQMTTAKPNGLSGFATWVMRRSARHASSNIKQPTRRPERMLGRLRDKGISVVELISSYGVYIVLVVGATAGIAVVYSQIRGNELVRDTGLVANAVQTMHTTTRNYAGITAAAMAESGTVPDAIVDGSTIKVQGSSGSPYTLDVNPGLAANGNAIGAATDRFFLVAITGIDTVEDCVGLAMSNIPGLKGIQIQTGTSSLLPNRPIAAAASGTTGFAYQNPSVSGGGGVLVGRVAADITNTCDTLITASSVDAVSVLLGFR